MGFLNRPLKKNLESRKHKIWQDVVSTKNALSMGKTVRCAWILPLVQNRTAVVLVLVINLSQKKCSYCYNSLDGISKPLLRRRKNKNETLEYFLIDTCNMFDLCWTSFPAMRRVTGIKKPVWKGPACDQNSSKQIQRILTTTWKKWIPCEYSH